MICSKKLYLCKRTNELNAEVGVYDPPVSYWVNYQPTQGFTDIMQYGERVTKIYRAILRFEQYAGIFKEGDLVYLCGKKNEDGTDPVITETYVNGYGANAKVISVRNQNLAIEVTFEKRIMRGEQT
jgi:hypothetical protein